jgi:hypothetical protein
LSAIVEQLSRSRPKVTVVWASLEFDDDHLASPTQAKEIDRPGRDARLPTDSHERSVYSELFDRQELRVHLQRLLQLLFWCLRLFEDGCWLVLSYESDLSRHDLNLRSYEASEIGARLQAVLQIVAPART